MPIDEWFVGQEVTVRFPNANEGSAKSKDTVITKIGRKYISVKGSTTQFDGRMRVPRATNEELYTRIGYKELMYINTVLHALHNKAYSIHWPIELMIQIGDYLGLSRPEHLRDDVSPELLAAVRDTNL